MYLNQTSNSKALLPSNRASNCLKRKGATYMNRLCRCGCKLRFCGSCCHSLSLHTYLKLITSSESALCCVVLSTTYLDPGGTIKMLFFLRSVPLILPKEHSFTYKKELQQQISKQSLVIKCWLSKLISGFRKSCLKKILYWNMRWQFSCDEMG